MGMVEQAFLGFDSSRCEEYYTGVVMISAEKLSSKGKKSYLMCLFQFEIEAQIRL